MKVSVVIPAYKAQKTINRALDSILAQTVVPDEIIVVDDGSPTPMPPLDARYEKHATLYRKPNGGASSARNHAIDRARGEFITFLDADDVWAHDKIEKQLALFERFPEINFAFTSYLATEPDDIQTQRNVKLIVPRFPEWTPITPNLSEAFRVSVSTFTGTVMVRRSHLGDRRFNEKLPTAEDRDLWYRLVKNSTVGFINEALATQILEKGSLSRGNVTSDYNNYLSVIDQYADEIGEATVKRFKAKAYRSWAGTLLSEGKCREAIPPALKRLQCQPFKIEGYYILAMILFRSLLPSK